MLAGRRKEERLTSGEDLRSALCVACDSTAPQRFDHVMLNKLIDFSRLPRDDPRRDPLELKQTLSAIDPGLGTLKLKQRKAMLAALEAQLAAAQRHGLPLYFPVDGGWPPKEPEPEAATCSTEARQRDRAVGHANERRRRDIYMDTD